jgi:hypothetical protein
MADLHENVIEWITGDENVFVTIHQMRFCNKVEKLAGQHPGECEILKRNKDGSILARLPLRWIRIQKPNQRELTDDEREELRERIKVARDHLTR